MPLKCFSGSTRDLEQNDKTRVSNYFGLIHSMNQLPFRLTGTLNRGWGFDQQQVDYLQVVVGIRGGRVSLNTRKLTANFFNSNECITSDLNRLLQENLK
jgi:hypothetical protein